MTKSTKPNIEESYNHEFSFSSAEIKPFQLIVEKVYYLITETYNK